MKLRSIVLLSFFVALVSIAASAQTTIKRTTVSPTSAADGKEMFTTYCAVCHGQDAKGDGPAAAALKKTPANLTTLTARNNGKFPELKVYQTIHGDVDMPSHGSRDMPMWGTLFGSLNANASTSGVVQLRISNLTEYVKSLQAQ